MTVEILSLLCYHGKKEKRKFFMDRTNGNAKGFLGISALLLFLTVILGRLTSFFYSVVATDIAYPDWLYVLLSYLNEIVPSLRTAVSYVAIGVAVYALSRKALIGTVLLTAGAAALDHVARFFLDYLSGAVTGLERTALQWLSLQFLYELIFMGIALLILLFMRAKYEKAKSTYKKSRFGTCTGVRIGLIVMLLSRIAMELAYLMDFLATYSDVTDSEIASIVGAFLKILLIYGVIPILTAEGLHRLFQKILARQK